MSTLKDEKPGSSGHTLLARFEEILRTTNTPMSAARLRANLSEPERSRVTETDVHDLLEKAAEHSGNIRRKRQGNLDCYVFAPGGSNSSASDGEVALYSPFCRLLVSQGMLAHPLNHVHANRGQSGEHHWRYPDVVAYRPARTQGVMAGLAEMTRNPDRTALIGYEIKPTITTANVRKSFFECLSNSFWANERYVASPEIQRACIEDFRLLAKRYPVGLIEIEKGSHIPTDFARTATLVECQAGDLDLEALDGLRRDWPDMDAFLQEVLRPPGPSRAGTS